MKKYQNTILWLFAILLTLLSAIYQRKTGPTYPIDGDVKLNNVTINHSLPRSHDTGIDAEIRIPAPDPQIVEEFSYRRFRSNDEWTKFPLQRTSGLLLIGGLILGPIVQNYAFSAYLTGWPIGHDLTDNKTIAAFIVWALAIWKNKDGINRPGWVLAASIPKFLVYMISHSVLGSELDYTTLV